MDALEVPEQTSRVPVENLGITPDFLKLFGEHHLDSSLSRVGFLAAQAIEARLQRNERVADGVFLLDGSSNSCAIFAVENDGSSAMGNCIR